MRGEPGDAGVVLLEPLVAAAVGLAVLGGVTVALAVSSRWLVRAGARAEAADTAALVAEAVTFDVRRAGWDPADAGIAPIARASALELELAADLDGDGAIAPASAERIRLRCVPGRRTLSRLVGNQSMPLAAIVRACGFDYLDRRGRPLATVAGEIPPADLSRIAAVVLDVTLRPRGSSVAHARRITVALRDGPR